MISNTRIKAVIIDDEVPNLDTLDKIISHFCPDILVVARCQFPEEAVGIVQELKPDIVFLDIKMPVLNGFDFLNRFTSIPFKVVFTTAFSEYALQAIKYAAFDFILKPIDHEEVSAVAAKLKNSTTPRVVTHVIPNNNMNTNLALPTPDGFSFIEISEILYCRSDNSYTKYILSNGKAILVCRGLRETTEMLERHGFFRIHQSFLVNARCIRKFNKHTCSILITNGDELPVSTRKKDEFLQFVAKI